MAASNSNSPFNDSPSGPLPEDVRAEVAYLRARGTSWEDTAQAVGGSAVNLRGAVRHDPNFPAALALARKEVEQEAEAASLQMLRAQLNDADSTIARKAAERITKYLGDKRRDETRLEIERLRVARAQAKIAARVAEDEEDELPPKEQTTAEKCARENTTVYLWGGRHKLGDTPPDATDTPLRLITTKVAGRVVYWAHTDPSPDPINGPHVAPPG